MSVNLSTVLTTMVQWAAGASGLTIVRTHQNAPRPPLPFGSAQLVGVVTPGFADSSAAQADPDDQTHRVWPVVTVQFSFFGSGALGYAHLLREKSELQSTTDTLDAAGIGIGVVSQVQDLPQIRENGWEESATIDFQLHVASEFTEADVGYIETVTTSSDIQ